MWAGDPLSGVDEATFRRELDIVRNEDWERHESHGAGRALQRLFAETYTPEDPYQRAFASAATPATITLPDARQFVAQHYRPASFTFMLDGDLPADARATIEADLPAPLTQRSGDIRPGWSDGPIAAVQAPAPFKIVREAGRTPVPELWIGWPLPSVFADDNRALIGLLEDGARAEFDTDRFRTDAPEITHISVQTVKGRRGSLFVCRALLSAEGSSMHAARAILEHVQALGSERLSRLSSIDLRRVFMHNLAMFADDNLQNRAARWSLSAHAVGDPAAWRHDLSKLLIDFDPLLAGDFIRSRFASARARAVLLTPQTDARPLPAAAPAGELARPAAGPVTPHPFPEAAAELAALTATNVRIETRALDNGLLAIVATNPAFSGVTTLVGFHGGSATESPPGVVEVTDVAGVFATTDLQCGSLARCGVAHQSNVFGPDSTWRAYQAGRWLLPHILDFAAQLQEIDWVLWPDDPPAAQYRARRRGSEASPVFAGERKLQAALFPDHRRGAVPTIGDLEDISGAAALAWSRRHQSASNAAVVVAGDVDAKQTLDRIAVAFGGWEKGSPPTTGDGPPPIPLHPQPVVTVTAWPGAPQAQVQLACRLPAATVDNVAWQDLFSLSLSVYFHDVLRERLGATYGFRADHHEARGGVSYVRAGGMVANTSLRDTLAELKNVLDMLEKGRWPSADEGGEAGETAIGGSPLALDRRRWNLLTARALGLANSLEFARELLHEWNMDWPVDGGARSLAALGTIARDEMAAAAHLCHDTAVLALTGEAGVVRTALAGTFR